MFSFVPQLPGAVRIAEVHSHARIERQLLVVAHLLAPVVGQRLAHGLGNAVELVSKRLQHMRSCCGVRMGQLDQYQQTRAALDQGADCAGIARTLDQITTPSGQEIAGSEPQVDARGCSASEQSRRACPAHASEASVWQGPCAGKPQARV